MLDHDDEERIREFARRLEIAMDLNRVGLPDKFKGRNAEIAKRMTETCGVATTPETVSKYTKGMMIPRPGRMQALARVLGVDLAWLQSGTGGSGPVYSDGRPATLPPASEASTRRGAAAVPNTTVAKYLGIALAQLAGARIVDAPNTGPVHFRAAVRGAVLSVHAVLGEATDDGWRVSVPKFAADTFVLGILPETPTSFRLVELYWDDVEAVGEDEGESFAVTIDKDFRTGDVAWTEITDLGRLPR